MKGHFMPIIELRKEYKLKFCEALPPCAKHREGDRCQRQWWWVVLLLVRFRRIEELYPSFFVKRKRRGDQKLVFWWVVPDVSPERREAEGFIDTSLSFQIKSVSTP